MLSRVTPGLCKKTKKINGTAVPKHARLIAERKKDNGKKESQLQYMEMEESCPAMKEHLAAKSIAIADLIIPKWSFHHLTTMKNPVLEEKSGQNHD
jgi:hypothetical protein